MLKWSPVSSEDHLLLLSAMGESNPSPSLSKGIHEQEEIQKRRVWF